MPDVQQLRGEVSVGGIEKSVQDLLKVAQSFDTAAKASTDAAKQFAAFSTTAQTPQTAASGVNTLTVANQRLTQSSISLTAAERQRIAAANQIAALEQRVAAAQTDAAGRVRLYTAAMEQATAGSKEYLQAQLKVISAQNELDRAQAKQPSGGIFSGAGGQLAGALGLAGGVAAAVSQINRLSSEGQQLIITMDTERRTLGALLGDVDRGNSVYAQAIAFGQKYGYTQEQMGQAAQDAALLIRNGNSSVAETLDVLARLQAKNPDKTFQDAVRAVTELQAGQFQSLERIFNIPAAAVQGLSDKIKAGADPIQELNGLLNQMGITDEILKTRTDGLTGSQNAYNQALETFKIRLGELRVESGLQQAQTTALGAGSGLIDLATGKIGLSDLVKAFDQAQKGGVNVGGVFGQLAPLLSTLAQAEKNLSSSTEDMTSRTKDDTYARIANTQAVGLSSDEYDRLTASLKQATDQGLRPYRAAVDDAKAALDTHKASLQADKDAVDSIKGSLDKAKQSYQDYAHAQLAGTKAYADQQFALDQQQARVQRDLLNFQAPGAGLDQALAPIQAQIEGTTASVADLEKQLDAANDAVDRQTRVVDDATAAQKAYDDAVGTAKDNLSSQQDRLSALQDTYNNLGDAIQSAKRDMDDLRHTALVGEGALDDKLFAMEQRIKRQQLIIDQARLRGAGKDEIKKLTEDLDKLRTAEDAARLAGEIKYDPQHRALEQQGVPRNEQTLEQASHDLNQYQQGVDNLTKAQQAAGQAVEDQKKAVRDAQFDLMDATAVQRDHTAAVDAEKATLEQLKVTQTAISKQYQDQKTDLANLKTQLNDTKDNALKPFKDELDDLTRRAELSKLDEKLELDPLKKKIHDLQEPAEKSYGAIIAGMQGARAEIDKLAPQLDHAQAIYDKERDATKAAQDTYDAANTALTAEQKYFDALKTGLDDANPKLATMLQTWQDIAKIQGIINDANTATPTIPGMRAPYTPGSAANAGSYNVQGINSVVAGTPLADQGAFISEMSLKYGVPVEVALAMWKIESQYGTTGAAVPNKNPGNLRASPLASGMSGGFAQFASWQAGIEGFFKLLSENTFGYKDEINQYKQGDVSALLKLITTYAPAGDNNNPQQYYQGVVAMIRQLLAIITNGSSTAAIPRGRPGVINDGTTADDPMPSQQSVQSLFGSGARIGDTYDADRTGTTGIHYGVDIIMDPGTPLRSPIDGLVIRTGQGSKDFQGGIVMILDTLGRQWYFGHVHNIQVREGQRIGKGTLLAYIGQEGHTHVQVRQHNDSATPIDPSGAIDDAAGATGATMVGPPVPGGSYPGEATGAGDVYSPQSYSIVGPRYGTRIATGLGATAAAIAGLLPNLDNLTKAVEGVGDASAAAADGMVNATDDILDHATYKNRDGSGQLAYLNQNGGLSAGAGNWTRTGGGDMSIGGPHYGDPIARPPDSMKGNDPTWGDIITATADAAGDAGSKVQDVSLMWEQSWSDMGDATVEAMQRAQDFSEGASANIVQFINTAIQRIDDLIGKIGSIPGIHVHTGADQHDPTDPAGGNTGNRYGNITINTRDGYRVAGLLRRSGF